MTLNDIFNFEKGVLQSSKNSPGEFAFITASEEIKSHNRYYYDMEAICFAFAASGSLGRTHYYNGKFTASDLVYVITPKEAYKDKVFLKFYYFYLNFFRDEIVHKSKSGTSKVSINKDAMSKIEVPIPPISEQKKIVTTLENVKEKIQQVQSLRNEQEKDIKNFLYSKYLELIEGVEWKPMSEAAPINRSKVDVESESTYHELGIRSFGRGTFLKPSFLGKDLTWQEPYWMKKGDIVFSNIKAWEGAVAIVKEEDDGKVGSHRYITCEANSDLVIAEFVLYYLLLPEGIDKLNLASPGTADRNRTLNTKKLNSLLIPVPDIELQKGFVALKQKMEKILVFHAETIKELDEMFSSLLDKAFKGK
jgi:type I restriction enzyme S subunit